MASPSSQPFFDVRMRGFADRADVGDVLAMLDRRITLLEGEETSIHHAAGRVLMVDVVSSVNVPPFDRAAMDGYALHAEETYGAGTYNQLSFRILGESLPGRPFNGEVPSGAAVRIMTGAPIPTGADVVVPAEVAEENNGIVRVVEAIPPGKNVGRRGEDIAQGQTIMKAGRILRPQDVGLLASIGNATVSVIRRPKVSILVTGDELLPPGSKPHGYQIVDSNSPMLAALIRRDGGDLCSVKYLPDNEELIRQSLLEDSVDVILISGGSSVGREDHAPKLVAQLGDLPVHGVALRPASPTGIGFIANKSVFLLPGNPVSCLCAYDLFAGRAIRKQSGYRPELPYQKRELPLGTRIVSAVGRVDYVRVRIVNDRVEPIAISGASQLSSTVIADGFVLVDRDSEGDAPGEHVAVYCYDRCPLDHPYDQSL
jgi:molybdopterin molybdotransferase